VAGSIARSNPNDAPLKYPGEDRTNDPADEYFANKPFEDIGQELMKRVDDYYEYLATSGRWRLYTRSYEYYFNGQQRGARIQKTGAQDEYDTIYINHYRNIIQHLVNNTTSQRPSFEPHATNTDYKSQSQTIVASGILEFYNRHLRVERYSKKAIEDALYASEGFVEVSWDPNLGQDYAPNPNDLARPYKQGDIRIKNFHPVDIIRPYSENSFVEGNWIITREFVNKYDEAVKFPDLADKILTLSIDPAMWKERRLGRPFTVDEKDSIPKYRFYHRKTPAVPQGRFVEFYSSEIVTTEGPLPTKGIPVYRTTSSEQDGSPFGYTIAWDLLALQEAIDALYSTVLTNQATFGVQNILMPDGANIGVTELAGGLNLIKYNPKAGEPKPLNLTNTPQEIFSFIQQLEALMETLSGVNSVTRGNPEASLKSGAALALVASQAIQFNSGLQQSYAQLMEDIGTAIVDLLKDNAKTPRMAMIAGKANRSYIKEFTGQDLSEIDRVTVDLGNPLSRTVAGRMQIADQLLNAGMVREKDEYITLLNTGKLEPMIEGQQAQMLLIRAENERMGEGEKVMAIDTDDHRLHIVEHGVVLSSPEARQNPKIVKQTLDHINAHIQALQNGNPVLLSLYGQPQVPKPQPAPPPGQPGMGGPPPGPMPALNPQTPLMQKAASVNMPNMPNNPMTGERFNNQTGGLPPGMVGQ